MSPEKDDFNSYMLTPGYLDRLKKELHDIAICFIQKACIEIASTEPAALSRIIDDFFEIYPNRPIKSNEGGSGFHNCFWLYIMARCLSPRLIVESGVWKGQTSWLFRMACPSAELVCFDVSFGPLIYKDDRITYTENDWHDFHFENVDPSGSFCFFDDHINQAMRVREAYDKGFRILLFDDNPPAHKLYAFGLPGVPTIDMLLDDGICAGELIQWMWNGNEKSYLYRQEDEFSAKELIRQYYVFPDVGAITRYGGFSFLSLVILVD